MTENRGKMGFLSGLTSALLILLLPPLMLATVLHHTLTNPSFYTDILKNARLIDAFVEAKNLQMNQKIREEIAKEVKLDEQSLKTERIRTQYEHDQAAFDRINKTEAFEGLKKQRKEMDDLTWKQARDLFPTEKEFEAHREKELARFNLQIKEIEAYREKNEAAIGKSEKEYKKTKEEYEDALSELESRNKKALKIIERNKDTLSAKMYADLEKLSPRLTRVMNDLLIEKAVRREIEKLLAFMTSYETQKARGLIYEAKPATMGEMSKQRLAIRLPSVSISLIVDEEKHGVKRKKHLLSQIFVEEIRRQSQLINKDLFLTLFRFSDTSLGEYFTGRYLKKAGLSIDNGVIHMPSLVLEGDKAEVFEKIMMAATYGAWLKFITAAMLLLLILFLLFSRAEGKRRLGVLKSLLLYPSGLILLGCGAALAGSRFLLDYRPDLIIDLTARSYTRSFLFVTAWHLVLPVLAVFGGMFLIGIFLRKLGKKAQPK